MPVSTSVRPAVDADPTPSAAHRGRVWRTPTSPDASAPGVHPEPDLDAVSPWPSAHRGRVWRTPVRSLVARRRQGLDSRSAQHVPSSRQGSVVAIAVAALIATGSIGVARLDDGPRHDVAPVAQVATPDSPHVSMRSVAEQIGADVLWARGITGAGVNVAVIDTGVAPVPAIVDKVVAAVDVSGEQGDPFHRFVDGNGHGTHIAGIVAGRDDTTGFTGIAPDAGIVSVKVAERDGQVSPSSLVTGIDWVVDHADEFGIRVINLAFDSNDASDYRTSEFAAAVERAWQNGVVVVTAAGNDGEDAAGLSLPASDPFVIAVGGLDTSGGAPVAADWTSRGDGIRNPDISAPAAHLVSLRAPGSIADAEHPEGYVDAERFLGSGSSQAAAVVSAVVALVLQERPELSPDQVKAVLRSTATPVAAEASAVGAGAVRADLAVDAMPMNIVQRYTPAVGNATRSTAPGVAVAAPAGSAWAGSAWAGSAWAGSAWAGSAWAGSAWAGSAWAGSAWAGSAWAGSAWAGSAWA